MAYVAGSATIAVNNATPKIGQKVVCTLTYNNNGGSNTVDTRVTDVTPFPATGRTLFPAMEQPFPGGIFAGGGGPALAIYDIVANAASKVYLFDVVLQTAGAVSIGACICLMDNATGLPLVDMKTTTPVTITAS